MKPAARNRTLVFEVAVVVGFWALLASVLLGLTGCSSMLPQKRTDTAAVQTAEKVATTSAEKFRRVTEGQPAPPPPPPPQVTVSGSSNAVSIVAAPERPAPGPSRLDPSPYREEVTYDSAGEVTAGTQERASASREISLPLGVTLILCALGIIAMLAAFWLVRRSSAAADAAWQAVDQALANRIRAARARAQTETDTAELSRLNAERADLEEERGRLAAHRRK